MHIRIVYNCISTIFLEFLTAMLMNKNKNFKKQHLRWL